MLYKIGPDYFEIQYKTTSDFFACAIVKKNLYSTYFIGTSYCTVCPRSLNLYNNLLCKMDEDDSLTIMIIIVRKNLDTKTLKFRHFRIPFLCPLNRAVRFATPPPELCFYYGSLW